MLGDGKQLFIGMVPGVAARIMGRSRQKAIGSVIAPIGLAFAFGPVASCTLLCVDEGSNTQHLGISRAQGVQRRRLVQVFCVEIIAARCRQQQCKHPCGPQSQRSHIHYTLPDFMIASTLAVICMAQDCPFVAP